MRRLQSRKNLSVDTSSNNDQFSVSKNRSFRRRFSSEDSIALESFSIKNLRHESPFKVQLEQLINFVSINAADINACGQSLQNLERIVSRTLSEQHEPSLLRLLKGFGWTGQRFMCSDDSPLDTATLLQALSNLYLKFRNIQSSILPNLNEQGGSTTVSPDTIGGVEQVLPFCPDILFDFLAQNPEVRSPEDVPCLSFTGACMLVDISGFSKFSGSMCSKGVTGLDELRQATNGFLGHFVKTVYEYNGDVVAFAGDALLCVFVDKHSVYSNNTDRSVNGSFTSGHGLRDNERRSLKRGSSFFQAAMKLQSASNEDDSSAGAAAHYGGGTASATLTQNLDGVPNLPPLVTRNPSNKSDFGTGSHVSELSVSSSNSCYRALRCASVLRSHQMGSLSTHIGVSYGNMKMALLGGYNGQWIYLMNGSCVSELSSCIEDAKAQQVVATEDCYARALEVYLLAAQLPIKSPSTAGPMLSPCAPLQLPLQITPPTPTSRHSGYLPPKAPVRLTSSMLPSKDGIGAYSSASSAGNDAKVLSRQNCEANEGTVQFDDIDGIIAVEETEDDDFIASASADSELHKKFRSVRFTAESNDSSDFVGSTQLPHQQHIQCRRPNKVSSNVLIESMASVPRVDSQGNLFTYGETSPNELGRVGFIQRMSGILADADKESPRQKKQNISSTVDDDDREIAEEEERLVELAEMQLNRGSVSSRTSTGAAGGVDDTNSTKHLSQREHNLNQLVIQRQEQVRKYISIRSVESYNSSTHDSSEMDREAEVAAKTQQALLENVAMFVPIPVLASLRYEALDHIGELRTVTTMFLSLDSYSPTIHSDPTTLQPFFVLAQEAMSNAGGFLRQFLVDDKGCVLIAMWGVPSFTYANNCSRALHCAVEILLQSESKLNLQCSIGITTGNVFCGSVGCAERRDYAGIGTDVNMAARLMAKANGRVLIDHRTYNNLPSDTKALLDSAEAMMLKGNIDLVTPYKFVGTTTPPMASLDENVAGTGNCKLLKKNITQLLCSQLDKIANSMATSIREARKYSPLGRNDFGEFSPLVRGKSLGDRNSPSLQQLQQAAGPGLIGGSRPLSLPRSPRSTHAGLYGKGTRNINGRASPILPENCNNRPISLPRTPLSAAGVSIVDSTVSLSGLLGGSRASRNNLLMSPRDLKVFGTVHFTILQGHAGTGKSTAAEYFRMEARKRGLHVVHITADSAHRAEPYGVVRDVFYDIVGLPRPSSLNAEQCSPDFLVSVGAASSTQENRKSKTSALEAIREKITLQVESLIKSLVQGAYEFSPQSEIDEAIESVRNVLGLTPSSPQNGPSNNKSNKNAPETSSGKAYGPFSIPKPTRTGSLLSTKGMSFSFGSSKSSVKRIDSHDTVSADGESLALFDQTDFPFQQSATSPRTAGDLAFYKVIANLLRNTPTALVIENAQNCDELSWQELLIMLMGFDLEMAILVTIRNHYHDKGEIDALLGAEEANGGSDSKEVNGMDGAATLQGSFKHVPKLTRVVKEVDDFNKSFIINISPEKSTAAGINFEDSDGHYETSEAYQAICNHSNCVVKTMTGLKEDGVRNYLLHTLKVNHISHDLVKSVYRISAGNFGWIKSIVTFIKERGVDMFEEAIRDEETSESALRALIIYRINGLSPTVQMVLRYASIVGHEFSERLLSRIVPSGTPRSNLRSSSLLTKTNLVSKSEKKASGTSFSKRSHRLRKASTLSGKGISFYASRRSGKDRGDSSPITPPHIISPALDTLTKLGFFHCVRESPVPLYEFQNEFVHATVYEMIPPSDAALIHISIAHYLEENYADNLVPFFPRLGFHYKHGTNGRVNAFKYEMKAASHCMSRGAYSDSLIFIHSAAELAEETKEYRVLLEVINYGLKTLGVRQGPFSSLYSLLSRALTKQSKALESEDFYLSDSSSAFIDAESYKQQPSAPPPSLATPGHRTPLSRGIAENNGSNEVSSGARTIDAYKRIRATVEKRLSNCIKEKNSPTAAMDGPASAPAMRGNFSPRFSGSVDLLSASIDSQTSWSNLKSKSRSKKSMGRSKEIGLTPEAIAEGEEYHAEGNVANNNSPVLNDAASSDISNQSSDDAVPLPPLSANRESEGCGVRCSCVLS